MFSRTARYYDLIYGFKDYAAEAEKIAALIRQEAPAARTILDVACGTAEHARFLSQQFQVDGVDLEPEFLRIARDKVPSGHFWLADMTELKLPKRYDVVQCLFSSIGYLPDEPKVVAALERFKEHLNPGGVILVEPWLTPEAWREGHTSMLTAESEEVKLCRISRTERDGRRSVLAFHYLIAARGEVEYVTEAHELTLFTREEMLSCFAAAGLEVKHDPEGLFGRGLYTARSPAT